MKKAAVIGNPIEHSKSPLIHNYWLKKLEIEGSYEAIKAVNEKDFENVVSRLIEKKYCGFNITVPYKLKAHELAHKKIDYPKCPYHENLMASNTIKIDKKGELHSYNTDYFGFAASLIQNNIIINKIKNIVILGAGGAARSIIFGLLSEELKTKTKITLLNRSETRAKNLLEDLQIDGGLKDRDLEIQYYPLTDFARSTKDCDLLINTTTLGMEGGKENSIINLHNSKKNMLVYDIVYNPIETPLLKTAKDLGLKTLNGLSMLINQAAAAFEIIYGKEQGTIKPKSINELHKIIEEDLRN
jgi:shikimate dehydrogenase